MPGYSYSSRHQSGSCCLNGASESSVINKLLCSSSVKPAVVERIVADIDANVCVVQFPGWQHSTSGEREVHKSLRKALFGVPKGIRTPVTAVKGRCPRPLDDGDVGSRGGTRLPTGPGR